MFSDFCSISALSCSFEFLWWVVVVVVVGGGSQQLLCLNPTTVMVVLLFGLWLLLGCDNIQCAWLFLLEHHISGCCSHYFLLSYCNSSLNVFISIGTPPYILEFYCNFLRGGGVPSNTSPRTEPKNVNFYNTGSSPPYFHPTSVIRLQVFGWFTNNNLTLNIDTCIW